MGRKAKEIEEMLAQRENEIASLKRSNEELNASLREYKSKETAISGALTRAQTGSDGIIREANEQKAEILARANEQKAEILREANETLADAKRRAEILESDAKARAKETAAKAEAFMADYKQNAESLKAELARMASEVAAHADSFREYAESISFERKSFETVETPDDYSSPSELMQNIYKIEHRTLPHQRDEQHRSAYEKWRDEHEHDPDNEHPVERLSGFRPSMSHDMDKLAQQSDVEEPTGEDIVLPEDDIVTEENVILEEQIIPEEKIVIEEFATEAAEELAPDIQEPLPIEPVEEPSAPIAEEPQANDDEDRVWTVEEIVERTTADTDIGIDDELNAIIDDVLKGT